jgi:hypothetical protein
MGGSPGHKRLVPDGFRRGEQGYEVLLEAQGGRCAICNTPGDPHGGRPLIPDHDHLSGRARGLLCHQCNTGLGMLADDPERLRTAIVYLTTWRISHAEQITADRERRKAQHAGVRRSNLYGPNARRVP